MAPVRAPQSTPPGTFSRRIPAAAAGVLEQQRAVQGKVRLTPRQKAPGGGPPPQALPSGVRGGGGGPLDSQGPLRRFVVVDGSCVMFRCYHAMPSLKNRDGDNVGAVMGFFRSLVQIRRLLSPSHLAVVFDHPTGRSSRLAISHSYKSHRTHPPLELTEQIQKAKHLCAAMGLLPLEVEGVEGDDVIATLVDRLCTEVSEPQQQQQERRESPVFDEVVVATVDKDLLQLLRYNYQSKGGTPRVSLLALHRQCRLLDRQFVEEEYGVDPHQLLDFFSLVGDRADGIVGCRGIGVAAAKKVLRAVESLEMRVHGAACMHLDAQSASYELQPRMALHASPEKLKKASLRPSQMAALKEFLPQWCTNRRLVALDCGVIPARSRSLTSFELTPVDPGDLKQMFAAYNLSKQADLWIQAGNAAAFSAGGSAASGAHGEIPSPEAAAKSQPYAGFSGAAVSSEAAASLAVVSASAAAKTSPAPAEGTHAADWQGGDATGDTAAEGLSDEGGVDTAAAAAATTGEAEGVPAAWIGNYGNSETAVSQAHAPEAPGVVLCGVHLSAAPQSLLPFRTDASRADAASFAVGTGSTPALPGAPSGRAAAEGAAQNAAWRQSEASPPRGSFAASLLSFWPRRLLFHRAAAPSNSVIGVAGCVYSAAEKASTAAAASPSLQAPFASLLPGSSDGSHALDSARLQDPLPFAFDHEGELLRNGDGQGSNKPAAPGDSASGSAAARRADSDGEADCNMQVRLFCLQERPHMEAVQQHMRQQMQAAVHVAAAADAGAAAAAATLKAATIRASRKSTRRSADAASADAASAAADATAATDAAAASAEFLLGSDAEVTGSCNGDTATKTRAASSQVVFSREETGVLPLLPPIECQGSMASPSPLQQAQAFHSTIVLCLRYLAVLQQFEGRRCCDSPFEAAAGVTLGGLLRQIPEPVPMDPLEMSLSIVAKSAATQSTPDVVKISHTCLEGGSKARNRPDTGAPLLPISVAWLASSPLGTHAPASALCPLHLSFSIHLPPGLSRLLADELPQQTPLQQPPLQQTPLQQPQQAVLDILHFHFPVSLLLRDSAAFQMLRDCLRMSGLPPANSGSSDRLKTDDAETAPPRSLSATTPNAHSPRILWAAHNAKQLLHLLLNIGLVPPANRQLHCTSVLSWLLHGANSRNSDLLQHAVLYELLQQRKRQQLDAPATAGERPAEPVQLDTPDLSACCDGHTAAAGVPPHADESSLLLPLLASPYASTIVETMTTAARSIADLASKGHRGYRQQKSREDPEAPARALKGSTRRSQRSSVLPPWHCFPLARNALLPPEQQQLQQGLFGRFGWGIYAKMPQKKAQRDTGPKDCGSTRLPDSAAGEGGGAAAATARLRLSFQPVVAPSPEPFSFASGTTQDGTRRTNETVEQQQHTSAGLRSRSRGLAVRLPAQFRRCYPPRSPEHLNAEDVIGFCESRGAATLVLLEKQQQLLLQQQQQAAEEGAPANPETVGLSLTWGVWAQVERPLIPTLVAVERRGLSLSTPILTDGWRANRGVALHAPETPDAADGAAGSGEPATTPQTPPGDFGEALQEQRILEQHIWRLIHQLTGRTNVNINSPSQLAEILFDVLQLSPPPSTRAGSVSSLTEKTPSSQGGTKSNPCNTGGRSTGAEALQALLREALSKKLDARSAQVAALLSALLKYRASHKFVSTYFASLPSYIFPLTHRIHFSLLQTGAATGRLACRNPNLQNIPNHQEEWRWIRRAFVPSAVNPCKADEATVRGDALTSSLTAMLLGASREDGSPMPAADAVRVPPSSPWRFLSIDYSQMELHILAYLSNDPQLLNDLSGGISSGETGRRYDSFQLTASRLFGCPPEDVTKERRSAAKTVTYGILYGQTEGGLSRQLRAPLKDARHLINCFFNEYKGVRALMHTHTQFAEATGTIETLIGRSRRLDGTDVVSLQLKQHAELGQLLQRIGAAKKPLPQQVGIATSTGSSTKNRCRRQAMNTPIQGLAADIMKYVTGRVDELLKRQQQRAFDHEDMLRASTLRGSVGGIPNLPPHYQALRRPLRAQVVLQIHDELLLEVHKEDISLTLELVLPLMQRAWGLLLVETNCLDRYAALCQVQRRLIDPLGHNDTDHESALASAGNGSNVAEQEIWFSLPDQYEWLRPFLQRKLPTSAKSGRDWACC
ncbi:uncharacterized protein LOC34621374 [Cyclospora cayetanensis]|uniref:Uncharacterized protein LOC34621374 n=1 Tax=Cyclospora cayetanensis TaxID=88456 RepID=A0A6P6RUD2_9EIME|nr:uncharacterized protein LOC34621374 [Cyclospora cayetanensis]